MICCLRICLLVNEFVKNQKFAQKHNLLENPSLGAEASKGFYVRPWKLSFTWCAKPSDGKFGAVAPEAL